MTQNNFQLWNSQSTKSAPQMMEDNQQFFQQLKFTLQVLIATMNEDANSTHYTM